MPKLRLDQLVVRPGPCGQPRAGARADPGGAGAWSMGRRCRRRAHRSIHRPTSRWSRPTIRTSAVADSSSPTPSTSFTSTSAVDEALDIGASTGGFTDVLLQRGAARVVALDVGHGQLDWKIRNDARVIVVEHFNARYLTLDDLPAPVDFVCIDVSFISLRQILPVLPPLLRPGADVVALVKPQFEAGRDEVRKGIIRDPEVHRRVLDEVTHAAAAVGLARLGTDASPITGQKGNVEFLMHLRHATTGSGGPVSTSPITRAGIVAKHGLAASGHLDRLVDVAQSPRDCRGVRDGNSGTCRHTPGHRDLVP